MSSGPATAGPTPRDASRPRSPDLVDPPLVEPYLTGDDYEAEGGHAPRPVAHLLRDIDYAAAKAALSMLPRRRRNQFQTVAQQQVYGAYSPAKFPDLFHRIIERFHQGPPDDDDDADELPSRPPPLNRTPEIPRAFSPLGHCGYTSRGDQDRPRPSTRDREQGFNYAAAGLKAFQPRHISFNGSLPVTTYISRLRRMARCYSKKAVLTNLPLAMEGDAGEWMDGLPQSLLEDMDDSLDMWIDQLRLRFSSNISEVLAKADALRHSFAEEDTLSVRQFLSQKVQLYREAGETSEDTMVRRMHRDLDPELARDSQVIAQSATSYRAWKQSQASIQSLIQACFASRPQPRDRDRFDMGRRFDTLATPRYAAYSTATAQATTTEQLATTAGITRQLLEGPPNETAAVPAAARRTAPPRYPCTHCGSLDHIDPDCSKHPRRVAAAARAVAKDLPRPAGAPTVPAVHAYYAEANSAPPDEDLMGFDDDGDEFPHADPLEGAENCLAGHLNIQWGSPGAPDHLVSPAAHHFKVLSQALLQRRKRAMLYATEAVTVLLGEGRNIRVKHRDLPQRSEGYLVSPHAQVDLALDVFGSLIQGVVNHQTARIPYANFGEAPIHIKAGQRLGILEPCPARTPMTASAFLGLAEVF
ncbi:hypothetical protein VE00_03059 [Pseudogymnoascus sp. WSF 3629]|nr:hypothetical protein VE00_03059 [Pseudogymnoascus sp. WSF 3629]